MTDLQPCPNCGEQMVRGQMRIEADAGSFVLFGLSAMDLVMRQGESNERRVVLGPRVNKRGAACSSCGTVILYESDYITPPLDESFAGNFLNIPPPSQGQEKRSPHGTLTAVILFLMIVAAIVLIVMSFSYSA